MKSPIDLIRSHDQRPFLALDNTVISYASFLREVEDLSSHILTTIGDVTPHSVCVVQGANNPLSLRLITGLLEQKASIVLAHTRWPIETLSKVIEATQATHLFDSTKDNLDAKLLRRTSSLASALGQDATVVVATSGTTATPKLAVLSLEALYQSAKGANRYITLGPGDCWSLSLPLFHAGGLGIFFRSICAGSAVAIALPHSPLPPTCAVPVTHVSLVPTQLYRLLKGNERNSLQNLSAILVGGAPLPATLIEQALAQKLPLFTTYGLTEMASQVTCQQAQLAGEEATAPVGKVLPYRELTLSDSGEILVRGETLFTGYLVGETVVPPCDNAGWFHTGDLGRFTSDGDLVVVGRQDAQFISGGENIHPEMIEAAISSLPGVVAACVVPISDNEFGQRPYAFILTENGEINEHELLTALRQKIPFFALPKQISAAPSKMVTATGKLSKAVALSILRGKE